MLSYRELMERINIARTKMGDVIKDFQASDAPQFKGKSKEKRRQMAIAAKLEADRGVKEEVEELDELSTDTLRNYRNKARDDAFDAHDVDDDRRLRKRSYGANQAGKKILKRGEPLRKEEVEQIEEEQLDELSPRTLGNYIKRRQGTVMAQGMEMQRQVQNRASDEERARNARKTNNAFAGVTRATNKLVKKAIAKEEIEQTDEELKGNQHKIDANKNGKVDSNDFKILRNAKKARYQ